MVNLRAKLVNGTLDILPAEITLDSIRSDYEKRLSDFKMTDAHLVSILKKKDEERSIEELKKIVKRKLADDEYKAKIEEFNSYKRYVEKYPEGIGENDSYLPYFEETDNEVIANFKVVKNDVNIISSKIATLKQELADSDWKVVRCYEAYLNGEDAPYDVKELTSKRASIREEINRLQELIK